MRELPLHCQVKVQEQSTDSLFFGLVDEDYGGKGRKG